jgi:serine protease AprX
MSAKGRLEAAERSVVALGGRIGRVLQIIDGFQAEVPASALPGLARADGVAGVSADYRLRPQAASYDPTADTGSAYNLARITGAVNYWKAGYTGAGVGVALVDSGVSPVDGLADPLRILDGPDLSFESQAANLAHLDTFGHGTHMAGIIGGRAAAAQPGTFASDKTNFLGMAPDSTILSVKVADAQGATDVSQVIAAIDWVVQHRDDPGLNIRVLNLSYGTDSAQSYTVDPLAYAAEQAWKAGIFVVAAVGNAGYRDIKTSSMTNPAYDPNIMAVGAADPRGTVPTKDDFVSSFSSTGNAGRRPDLVAPGAHIVSLRDPGSAIDQAHSATGEVTTGLFRGSGTSQATAVVSGAAALIIQQRPAITPGQLKALLVSTATPLKGMLREQQGAGELNLAKVSGAKTPAPAAAAPPSTGTGSLDLARGTSHLTADGVTLAGEQDIFGAPFDAAAIAQAEATGTSWTDGTWNGSKWSGDGWSGSKWCGTDWTGSKWSGSDWSSVTWSSNTWDGSKWSSDAWTDAGWTGSEWTVDVWAGFSWS